MKIHYKKIVFEFLYKTETALGSKVSFGVSGYNFRILII